MEREQSVSVQAIRGRSAEADISDVMQVVCGC